MGSNGSLTGFAGGVDVKLGLLELEKHAKQENKGGKRGRQEEGAHSTTEKEGEKEEVQDDAVDEKNKSDEDEDDEHETKRLKKDEESWGMLLTQCIYLCVYFVTTRCEKGG